MKKVWQSLSKIAPALVSCLVLVLNISANSTASYYFNQPEPPKGLDGFKHIK